jgi:hypothetical protein
MGRLRTEAIRFLRFVCNRIQIHDYSGTFDTMKPGE